MVDKDIIQIHERLATLEAKRESDSKKITEIHKALMGNGQPGLIADVNQAKGGWKLFQWIAGTMIGLLSVSVSVLAYIK